MNEKKHEEENGESTRSKTDLAFQRKQLARENFRWWIKLVVQPALLVAFLAILFATLGLAQRMGWMSRGGGTAQTGPSGGDAAVNYICPMMCTPPQAEPGRCPVCAMELVPATSGGRETDSSSIRIDPAARRVANIQTVSVKSVPMSRTIRAIGELSYDEGSLKTISAYVDGRIERLYADFIGVDVNQGDQLALVYSPRLYSGQVELLSAKRARQTTNRSQSRLRSIASDQDLYDSARQRLIEMGMTTTQISALEKENKANSRMHLHAPISGTVIDKFAVEGEYVEEGRPIYKLADLSKVWLMLELVPQDAAAIRYGQKVEAVVQSLPAKKFSGRVVFIDPNVDPKTRTVGVRVVMPNPKRLLRVGDFAKATIDVPLLRGEANGGAIYDAELADKWISPRHPHVIESAPGKCPICNVDLVPASQFGFSNSSNGEKTALVIPRDAVLMAAENSVVYAETEPGRFQIRPVVLGPTSGDQIVVLDGVKEGEKVATRGNFLIDSQMQLAGNRSLIDPIKAQFNADDEISEEVTAALLELSENDRRLAEAQRVCPVTDARLGSMGPPKKVDVDGVSVFICCEGCRERLLKNPEMYLAKLNVSKQRKFLSDDASTGANLPPIVDPVLFDSSDDLPPIATPQLITEPSSDNASQHGIKPSVEEAK